MPGQGITCAWQTLVCYGLSLLLKSMALLSVLMKRSFFLCKIIKAVLFPSNKKVWNKASFAKKCMCVVNACCLWLLRNFEHRNHFLYIVLTLVYIFTL